MSRIRDQLKNFSPLKSYIFFVFIAYLVLVSLQITTSSVGILKETGASKSGVLVGDPRPIRSDEYLRSTPEFLGSLEFDKKGSILDASFNYTDKGSEPLLQVFLSSSPDRFILNSISRIIPRDSGFALTWWYSTVLVLVTLPLFMRKLGVSSKYAIASALVVVLSPSSQWWSGAPIGYIATASLGGLLLIHAVERRENSAPHWQTWLTASGALLGILILVQFPFAYPPWSIPVSVIFGSLMVGHAINLRKEKRFEARAFIAILFGICLGFGLKLYTSISTINAVLDTVYPGQRRAESSGTSMPLFSTNLISNLANSDGTNIILSNQSELSISLLELSIIVLALIPLLIVTRSRSRLAYPLIISYVPFVILMSWLFPIWPNRFLVGNPLTIIPPVRLAQILSLVSVVLFFILLSLINENAKAREGAFKLSYFATLSPLVVLIVLSNQQFSISFVEGVIGKREIIIGLTIFMLALIGIAHNSNWIFSLSTIALIILISIPLINPIQKGSGDLTHSEIAVKIDELDKSRSDRWASDTLWLDSLLLANTKEHLSGQQMTGPNKESWQVLDPKEEFVESWNRGASYVTFLWTEGSEMQINSPGRDIVQISIDPCDAKLSALSLDYILTGSELSGRCLSKLGTYTWQDAPVNIYQRKP